MITDIPEVTAKEMRGILWRAKHGNREQRRTALSQLSEMVQQSLLDDARQAGLTLDPTRPKDDPLTDEQWLELYGSSDGASR